MLALFVVACGGGSVTTDEQTEGTLQLPLTASSSDGSVYRLVGATFNITGTQTVTLTDTSADTVQTPLTAGTYTVELTGPWTMERMDAPGTAVAASLMSPNPLPFVVTKGETTVVRFLFKLPGNGTAEVGIQVDSGGYLAGTFHVTERINPYYPNEWDALVGKDVPFLISFETATYTRNESYGKYLDVFTGPVTVQFGGPYSELLQRAASSMKGGSFGFSLAASSGPGSIQYFAGMFFYPAPGPQAFRFDLGSSNPFQGSLDSQGFPSLRPFQFTTPEASLMDDGGYEGVRGTATVNGSP